MACSRNKSSVLPDYDKRPARQARRHGRQSATPCEGEGCGLGGEGAAGQHSRRAAYRWLSLTARVTVHQLPRRHTGLNLCRSYWQDEEQTAKVMQTDDNGTLWMHTGDEAIMDEEGYLRSTSRPYSWRSVLTEPPAHSRRAYQGARLTSCRDGLLLTSVSCGLKDIIIRGGEVSFPILLKSPNILSRPPKNLFPVQIENVLTAHPAIVEAAAVAVPDARYGELVGAWIVRHPNEPFLSREEVRRTVATAMNPQVRKLQ